MHKISFEVRTFYNKREKFELAIFDGLNSINNDPNLPVFRGFFLSAILLISGCSQLSTD
tara:strand:+ start:75 stop:251 length:177 start_codon:yes stop_codon:yes gene_type:complete